MSHSIHDIASSLGFTLPKHLAWVGCNATTGAPHPLTGCLSMYGAFRAFKTRAERDAYVAAYYDPNGNNRATACGPTSGRRYRLGVSLAQYAQDLAMADYGEV